jgi:hypothetical protein
MLDAPRRHLPMGDAASRRAGGNLGPWPPQAATTQCFRQGWDRAGLQEGLGNTPRRAVEHRAERASHRQPGVQGRPFRHVASLGEPPRGGL